LLPLTLHKVEENLEIFLFACGAFAVTVSQVWSGHLVRTVLTEPIKITLAVLIAGLLFRKFNKHLQKLTHKAVHTIGLRWTLFFIVLILGITSSVITAIIAALILSEIAVMLPLERAGRTKLVIFACYAIGMGAVLTSIGEPLGTIVISKLSGEPHHAGFFYLIQHVGWFVVGGVLFMAGLASSIREGTQKAPGAKAAEMGSDGTVKGILVRAGKVYLFVVALGFLGDGLKPLAMKTIAHVSANLLYWINMLSAVLDNATLAAIEVTPAIDERTLTFLLMSLIVSGGMLIPGNIPNIICASKLGIKSKEWVKVAFGLGIVLLVSYFVILTAVF
jgi:predicted cation transporter